MEANGGDSNLAGNANGNINANVNANANANTAPQTTLQTSSDTSTLPDENTLVSFNPIIELKWTEDQTLYVRTGYVREMKNAADSAHSYLRWHRLIFSPQPTALS
jgi:hypothetical protein